MSRAASIAAMAPDPLDIALRLHRRGDLESAESAYASILAASPRSAGALAGLGLIACSRNQPARALALLEEARRIAPREPAVLNNYGLALAAAGREEEALAAWRRALTISPRFADAQVNLANADVRAGRVDEAIRRYRSALATDGHSSSAAANLGGLLVGRRAYSEAVRWLERAAILDPANADVLVNLGRAYSACGLARQARLALEGALQRRPGDRVAASNLLLALHYCDDVDADTIADAHRAWGRTAEPGGAAARPEPRRDRQGRLRVGLLSADFNDHAVMRFLAPLLERHDRTRLELRCYHTGLREDASTADARRLADAFIEAGALAEPDLAERLRADALDILVDLSGHSSGGRPGVLASRPAPLQASWLGYLDTTGLAAVDFRISDGACDPPGLTERLHTERLWRLETMWCYQPRADAPEPEPTPAIAAGHVTFGSTNNPAKLSDSALSLWAGVLREVHGSRLLVHAHDDPLCRDRITKAFADQAIDPDRIAFFGRESAAGYLRRYATMDVLLDTTPYSGGTTTCDALWMGVPVVTLAGDRPFSRTSASVLQAAGCPEWIATDRDGYVRIARSLAEDLEGLGRLRRDLREKLRASRLMDADAFARSMEAALAAMQSALVPAQLEQGNRP